MTFVGWADGWFRGGWVLVGGLALCRSRAVRSIFMSGRWTGLLWGTGLGASTRSGCSWLLCAGFSGGAWWRCRPAFIFMCKMSVMNVYGRCCLYGSHCFVWIMGCFCLWRSLLDAFFRYDNFVSKDESKRLLLILLVLNDKYISLGDLTM